jgi:hypothetical protein
MTRQVQSIPLDTIRTRALCPIAEAARSLHRLLATIESGEIDADDPKARALQRRLEGVVAAWEETASDREGVWVPRSGP